MAKITDRAIREVARLRRSEQYAENWIAINDGLETLANNLDRVLELSASADLHIDDDGFLCLVITYGDGDVWEFYQFGTGID